MLDLDTNLDFGNIHLDRRFWLSGWLAVQTKARLVDFAAGSLCALRRVGFGRKTAIADDRFRGLRCRLLFRSRFRLVLVRGEIGLCRQIVRGGRRGFHRCLLQGKHLVVVGIREHRIPAATILALVTINAGVAQTGIFVPLEFVHSIVHQGIVEYTQ